MATTRRGFLAGVGVASTAIACGRPEPDPAPAATAPPPPPPPAEAKPRKPKNEAPALGDVALAMKGPLPRRPLGKTGVEVSLLCLGGYHLGTLADEADAVRVVHEAMDHGIDFFDCAWEYHDGKSEDWLGKALEGRRDKAFVMTKVCTHGRDAAVAMTQLEDSLRRLRTDHLDLWQVHEVVYDSDPALHHAAGGVLEALDRARQQGKVRFVGFTGHKDPAIHLDMLERGHAYDTVQMPLNCFDGAGFRSFEQRVLPVVARRGLGALAMKAMGGSGDAVKKGVVTAQEALGYAMSLPVASVVTGVDSVAVLHQNLNTAGGFQPWSAAELQALRDRVRPLAADGRFELFKTSKKYDGKPGREQHGFASDDELPT
jgi:aryl-alcohol dehydrogenase-like predicted oxidoreductase